ncbi:prolipoprotein diacylglyceryl transferase [Myceligenerans pegani]|uniref:Phosphatidylglycerol--prolipoprotein diacylglyceryl transferase n=1 Tax=Myceligenerans pegani TaxID=2776917 RepID=A0ABR9N2A4_9MICO|nr:prolipoprotein diacylglyceryl transferase [Myceligenerans sp. TRM 65318]MBE1877238.1 prolipoprotein diacylglyceryl transferase [Myceligenerans sp. TRM 65318]MBE3019509.1 prolipoprotein diacylglyceryl transferase [Myceligenerans sp. TRM 65318]
MHYAIPSPPLEWNAIPLGPLTIHVYALWLLAGIAAAAYLTQRRLTRRGAPSDVVLDIVLWAVPLGIVGARIYHVLTHTQDYFYAGADPWDVVRIWDGGNAIFGSLIGGAVGAWIACRRAGIRFWSFADALAPAMLVAQAIGRGGNWWNHELFGNPTTLPWGLEIDPAAAMFPAGAAAGTLFHPLFLYEALWNLVGAGLLLALDRRYHLRWGRLFALYMVWYGVGRAWLELLRIDPTSDTYLGLPANSAVSIVVALLGIVLFVLRGRQHPEREESVFVPGREPSGNDEPADATTGGAERDGATTGGAETGDAEAGGATSDRAEAQASGSDAAGSADAGSEDADAQARSRE